MAHGELGYHLAGVQLCVDEGSVLVDTFGLDPERAESARQAITRTLERNLDQTLRASQVDFRSLPSCAGKDGYVMVYTQVRYLDPATYDFGEGAYGYALSVQTGEHVDEATFLTEFNLPEPSYLVFTEDQYSEPEGGAPFEQHVIGEAQGMITELAALWWDDNLPASPQRRYLPQVIGAVLALVTAAALLLVLARRARRPGG